MGERRLFELFVPCWIALAAITFALGLRRRAPYGRHATAGVGPVLDARWGWVLMEAPSPLAMVATFALGRHRGEPWAAVFLALWLAHYVHRTVVQPFRWRARPTPIPLLIAGGGAVFNVVNGCLVGRWLFHLSPGYPPGWFGDPRFVVGLVLFALGAAVNVHADEVLRGLRRAGEGGYRVPYGGMYRWVSCPNYLGETVEWTGFALLTWCAPALSFAVWTAANLVPRALAHHRWYRERFVDYPPERRAVVPFVL